MYGAAGPFSLRLAVTPIFDCRRWAKLFPLLPDGLRKMFKSPPLPAIKCNATLTIMVVFVIQISELQNMKQALVVATNTKVLDSIIEAIAKVRR